MTDYHLDSLGTREFEHLAQALAAKSFGPALNVFGDGPDGGREATWEGAVSLAPLPTWDGYGVLQAKFQARPESPAENLKWFREQIHTELNAWAAPGSARSRKPDYFLIVTNTRLSGVPGKGKDAARALVADKISSLKLPIKGFHIWDYDALRALLDSAHDIRRRYAAFLTSGDVISQILDAQIDSQQRISDAIAAATASSLAEESPLNLTQAGVMSESGTTVSQVFVDLPFGATNPTRRESALRGRLQNASSGGVLELADDDDEIVFEASAGFSRSHRGMPGIAASIIRKLNSTRDASSDEGVEDRSFVVIGGPGQGKSTVTQWLAQVYRSAFLEGSPTLRVNRATGRYATAVQNRAAEISMPRVAARRWPYRVILTELADHLAVNPKHSVLEYLSHDISARSTTKITPEDLLTWAKLYPWVIFVDGLDEVPPSSNRVAVLAAISRLTVELDTVGADTVLITTTRPQGYGDELSTYTHLWLAPLTTGAALTCAEVLIAARHGSGTKKANQVMDRLKRASREQSTSRLFKSPLQVTILTVLLEKLGKAPGDRSRLFSAYYDVISSREQEKSGDLSDLLQRYETDILALHRQIGFLLQDRASSAGETSATLSLEEFHGLIRAQFRKQGHGPDEAEELVSEFARLVTDRLVFLAYVVGDRIGFEIRSLQEYMAGEQLVSLPQKDVIPALREIAGSAYWRNVALFAFGSIFARLEHLRAEAVLLCSELNRRDPVGVLFLGSELAIQVLRDGSCLSMPVYADPLAQIACEILGGPITPEVRKLARTGDDRVQRTIDGIVNSTTSALPSSWINRLLYASAASPQDQRTSQILEVFEKMPSNVQKLAVRHAWIEGLAGLYPIIDLAWRDVPPATFFADRGETNVEDLAEDAPSSVVSLTRLSQVLNEPPIDPDGGTALWGNWVPLHEEREAWTWLLDACSVHSLTTIWDWGAPLARFALEPSPGHLAEALRAIARSGAGAGDLPARTPWIVTKCLREAQWRASERGEPTATIHEELVSLAADSEAGLLGDASGWKDAEAASEPTLTLSKETLQRITSHGTSIDPDLSSVPLSAMMFAARSVHDGQNAVALQTAEELIALSARLPDGADRTTVCELALFELGIIADGASEAPVPKDVARLSEWATATITSSHIDRSWWPWWGTDANGELAALPSLEVMTVLGESKHLHKQPDESVARHILQLHRADRSQWQLLRLSISGCPGLIADLTEDDLGGLESASDDPRVATMTSCLRAGMAIISREKPSQPVPSPLIDTRFSTQWLLSVGRLPGARMDLLAEIGASLTIEDPKGSASLVSHARSTLLSDKPVLTVGLATE